MACCSTCPKRCVSVFRLAPPSNPAAHQGRIRVRPHVEGQWAAHFYLPIPLSESKGGNSKLHRLLQRVVRDVQLAVPAFHSFVDAEESSHPLPTGSSSPFQPSATSGAVITLTTVTELELHVSLSRAIFLRAHQREDLRKAVKRIATTQEPCVIIT